MIMRTVSAQDTHFTQYFSNPLYLNPAFAGSAGCSRIAADGSIQWPNSFSIKTATLSYDQYVRYLHGGLGYIYQIDVVGAETRQSATLNYSYQINFKNNMFLVPAISVGLGDFCIDWRHFNYIVNPPAEPYSNKLYFNLGAGLLFYNKNLAMGLAIDHINRPNNGIEGVSHIPVKYTFHFSYQFKIKEIATITPTLIYLRQFKEYEINPAILFKVWHIKFGVGNRTNLTNYDEIWGMLGYENNWMSIGYSYDYSLSGLTSAGIGASHEITTLFKFNCRCKTTKPHISKIKEF